MNARETIIDTSFEAAPRRPAFDDAFAARARQLRKSAPQSARIESHQPAYKRVLDLVVAVLLLIPAIPLMTLIACAIRIDSRGPVLFRQKRVGLGGDAFDILKFRTMHVLEDGDDIVQASKDDARITRIGRGLRKSSLDELPQLINVVRGEMSIVGPRPHALAHDRLYGSLIQEYVQRHRVKPGITGWAQVHGLRGETPTVESMRERVRRDVWYAQHANLLLDLRILLRTPREVLRQRNAF